MNTRQAKEGMYLFNGETFAHKVASFGDLSNWQEVTEEFKAEWDAQHPIEEVEDEN